MTNLPPGFTILALETSCDETAAAVVRDGSALLSNVVASQMDMHRRYGGVVPEVASRQHILSLVPVVEEALAVLPNRWDDLHAVAATYGPGLSGALLTGLNAARAMAWRRSLPFVGVNHLEAHIYASWLAVDDQLAALSNRPASPHQRQQSSEDHSRSNQDDLATQNASQHPESHNWHPPRFPLVALVVSGGHTLLALLRDHGDYQLLGQTRDDAVGEAFDKVARILGLGYPGGPAIQQAAAGVSASDRLPRAWLRNSYDFSFSGLKTAVLHAVQDALARGTDHIPPHRRHHRKQAAPADAGTPAPAATLSLEDTARLAHAFQESVVDVLVSKTVAAAQEFGATEIVLAGGVAANTRLRGELAARAGVPVRYPPIRLCTDNAAMIAAAAYYRFDAGAQSGWDLDVVPGLRLGE